MASHTSRPLDVLPAVAYHLLQTETQSGLLSLSPLPGQRAILVTLPIIPHTLNTERTNAYHDFLHLR
jgi:hypothetical protein